jgi:Fungal N-terminal domain of STAND proteins
MADPLSITANIVAVLGFSIQSCDFLVNFFKRITDAPAEVQHNVVWLKALHSTFSQLHALGHETQVELPSGFNARLEDCRADLLEVESRVRRVGQNLKASRIRHAWTRLRYAFVAEQWFVKFSQRLQKYQTAFTLDLMVIQM